MGCATCVPPHVSRPVETPCQTEALYKVNYGWIWGCASWKSVTSPFLGLRHGSSVILMAILVFLSGSSFEPCFRGRGGDWQLCKDDDVAKISKAEYARAVPIISNNNYLPLDNGLCCRANTSCRKAAQPMPTCVCEYYVGNKRHRLR